MDLRTTRPFDFCAMAAEHADTEMTGSNHDILELCRAATKEAVQETMKASDEKWSTRCQKLLSSVRKDTAKMIKESEERQEGKWRAELSRINEEIAGFKRTRASTGAGSTADTAMRGNAMSRGGGGGGGGGMRWMPRTVELKGWVND